MGDIPEDWLERFNQRMGEEGVHYSQRPFRAISEWTRLRNCSVSFPSPTASKVFNWFQARSAEGSHEVGSVFTGVFFFDSYFWPVYIPIAYGTPRLDALDWLHKMPEPVKQDLVANKEMLTEYVLLWTDCLDYAYGFEDLMATDACSGFALELLLSADRSLRATVELLTQKNRPNSKAIETARMSTEMFLKAYLAAHAGLDPERAQNELGHKLLVAAEECLAVSSNREFELLRQAVNIYPPVKERYKGKKYSSLELWRSYSVAQTSAVIFIRSLTDRDSRGQLKWQSG
ncbi:MAG: hypothetical protein ABSD63_06435 [Candidatus Korobacteraceae bacterium]|jgi:hypothetical protein